MVFHWRANDGRQWWPTECWLGSFKLASDFPVGSYPRGQKFHLFALNYECTLERTSNSSQSIALGKITSGSHITYYSLMFCIAYAFKGQVHVFKGRVKSVSHLSCRMRAILKYFCPLVHTSMPKEPLWFSMSEVLTPQSPLWIHACLLYYTYR